ncbi:MAG: hypothetical protein LBL20_07130, partial [Treponema sp.]|nr:hypothetical protein [Treponema sp.]
DKFSFRSDENVVFELAAYDAPRYESIGQMALDIQGRLGSSGDISGFSYYGLDAALMELSFPGSKGWALFVELEGTGEAASAGAASAGTASAGAGNRGPKPKLLALAFGPAERAELQPLYLSVLDSVAPAPLLTLAPGPITEFAYPRENRKQVRPANSRSQAWIFDTDAEAAQSLVDREFGILRRYESGPYWKEAWIRFYRAIYRDSFDRLRDIALALGQEWARGGDTPAGGIPCHALKWVQSFSYERDLMGSDFVNLVSAALEGRGDCDTRSLLWAVVLSQAEIPAAIMVSRDYSHAMGLTGIDGPGARFEFAGREWLVAETTAQVSLGLINSETSDSGKWIGVNFY